MGTPSSRFIARSIPNLDKLRGFAAMSVVLYHVIELTHWTDYPFNGVLFWGRIGWMGVDLFFVISGFVISLSAWSLFDRHGVAWGKHFWQRRITRIAPLYLVTMTVFVTLIQPQWLSLAPEKVAWHGITHILFIHNLFPGTHGSIDGANWSIGVEMQFYLLIYCALPWIMRASLVNVVVAFFVTAWTWRLAVFLLLSDHEAFTIFQYTTQLPGTLDQFGLGIVLCKIVVDPRYARIARSLGDHPVMLLFGSILCCSFMLMVFRANSGYWDNPWMVVFFRSAIGLAALALVLVAMTWPWRAPRLLSRPLDFLGEISYGLYLWHLPVILSLQRLDTGGTGVFFAKTVLATVVLATLSYYIFERHWMRSVRQEPADNGYGRAVVPR